MLSPFSKALCSPVSCCPVVARTGAQDQSQALEKVQEGASAAGGFQKQAPGGPRSPGHATCPRPGRGIALLLPVFLQLDASGREVSAMSLPSSHLLWELLMLLKNSADPFPCSLPLRCHHQAHPALHHQECLPKLNSPLLFPTPFPLHALDLSCMIPTLPVKCS